MKITKMLIAAGIVLAGATAAVAETGFEPTGAVPNGLLGAVPNSQLNGDERQQLRHLTAPDRTAAQSAATQHAFDAQGRPARERAGAEIGNGPTDPFDMLAGAR